MSASSSNVQQRAAPRGDGPIRKLAECLRDLAASLDDNGSARYAPWWRTVAVRTSVLGGLALLAAFSGSLVAISGWNALFLCAALIGCAFVLRDFRVGVALLILLLPVSRSTVFPHAIFGITGLNPFNLLLAATLGSCLLRGWFDGSLRRFLPRPLLWLYIVPLVMAGALGSRHVGDIAPGFFIHDLLDFHDTAGYLRELVAKPLLIVVFALLVGAAVSRSARPDWPLAPMLASVWVMGLMAVVFVVVEGVALNQLAGSESRGTLSALGLHANELGRFYAIAYALLLFTWAETKGRSGFRLVLLASMGLMVVALTLTFSRGAFFGFVVINVLFLAWRRSAKTLALAGFVAIVALLALPDAVYDRMATGFGGGLNAISAGRVDGLWLPLAPEVLRSPVYGNGLGSILWSDAMRAWGGGIILGATHPHNAYLEILLDMGLAGLILLCAFFAHVWRGLRALAVDPLLSPTLRGFYLGAAAGLASFLVAGVTDSSLAPRPEQAFLWLAIGMMYGQRTRAPDRVPWRA